MSPRSAGQHSIDDCPDIDGWGYADEAPSFTLTMSQMTGYQFTAETTSDCDPTMIIRDAFGQWHFNDGRSQRASAAACRSDGVRAGRAGRYLGRFFGATPARAPSSSAPAATRRADARNPVAACPACPNPAMQGPVVNTTGVGALQPDGLPADGRRADRTCRPAACRSSGWGFFPRAEPSYSFFLSGMEEYRRLEIEGESSCDTVMLRWARPMALSVISTCMTATATSPADQHRTSRAMLNGRVDVLGRHSYGGGTCAARIEAGRPRTGLSRALPSGPIRRGPPWAALPSGLAFQRFVNTACRARSAHDLSLPPDPDPRAVDPGPGGPVLACPDAWPSPARHL